MSIFQHGVWSLGLDFLPDGAVTASNIFDSVANGSTGNVGSAYAATAGKGIRLSNGTAVGRTFQTNASAFYMGFHWRTSGLPGTTNGMLVAYDSTAGSQQFNIGYNSQGQIGFYGAGGQIVSTNLGNPSSAIAVSSSVFVVPNIYNFIEIYGLISATSGVLTLKVNGATAVTFSGNTKKTANAWVNQVFPGNCQGSGVQHDFDNIYILDTTGSSPLDTFLGPGRIQTDGPSGDSATGGLNAWSFTTPQGSDHANAANIPANTAQYNSSSTVGNRMSFTFPSLSVAQVLFLNTWITAEEDAAGVRGITPIYRKGGTDQTGTAINLTTGYGFYNQVSTTDPSTGASWASEVPDAAAGCEIGVQLTT